MKPISSFVGLSIIAILMAGTFSVAEDARKPASPTKTDPELVEVATLVEKTVNQILGILRNREVKRDERRKQVTEIVEPFFHLDLIAKLSLGKTNWKKFSKPQREEFTQLFIQQLKDSFFERIDLFADEKIEFSPASRVKGKLHAPTTVISKDQRYEVIYKIYARGKKTNKKYLVYDVEIEGVSLVKSFNLQYDQFLAKNSTTDLLKKMKEKVIGPPDALQKKADEKKAKGKA